jgi:hypothetical protein
MHEKSDKAKMLQTELEKIHAYCEQVNEENQILKVQISSKQSDFQRCLKPSNIPIYDTR